MGEPAERSEAECTETRNLAGAIVNMVRLDEGDPSRGLSIMPGVLTENQELKLLWLAQEILALTDEARELHAMIAKQTELFKRATSEIEFVEALRRGIAPYLPHGTQNNVAGIVGAIRRLHVQAGAVLRDVKP